MQKYLQNISRETERLFVIYVDLLQKWNKKINLIGRSTEESIWQRHVLDAQQLLDLIPEDSKTLLDIGSGAGIPGFLIALARPEIKVTLVDSDQKKCAFLSEAKRVTSCNNVEIMCSRIESLAGSWDVVTARALAELQQLLRWSQEFSHPKTCGIWLKGKDWKAELEDAKKQFLFDFSTTPSKTNAEAVIIITTKQQLKCGPVI